MRSIYDDSILVGIMFVNSGDNIQYDFGGYDQQES
jgi:hypothetical protein